MAAKPGTLPVWATDANLASGSQNGQTTVLEPSLGYKQQGCVPGRSAPGRYLNWLWNLVYQWVVYLNDLHGSAEFLNKSYTWLTGVHRFTNGARFAGVSLESGDVLYTDAAGAASPRLTTHSLPLDLCPFNGACDWSIAGAGNAYSLGTGTDEAMIPVRLRTGVTVRLFRAWANDGGGTIAINFGYFPITHSTGALGAWVSLSGSLTSTGTNALVGTYQNAAVNHTIDNASRRYAVLLSKDNVGSAGEVHDLYVTFDDPGFKGNG